jgi:hypothetical protein
VALVVAITLVIVPSVARASAHWSAPTQVDSVPLVSVSCPSGSFCAAVDSAGNAVTFNGTSWSVPLTIDAATTLSSVSCPSASSCVAVDRSGNAVTYNGSIWGAPASIDPTHSLSSVSCPSASFCLAVDINSYFVSYEGGSWSPPAGLVIEQLSSVSCPSASFCAAVNNGYGWAPTYDGSTWGPNPMSSLKIGAGLRSVSCSSAVFCATVDDAGEAFLYTTPPPCR